MTKEQKEKDIEIMLNLQRYDKPLSHDEPFDEDSMMDIPEQDFIGLIMDGKVKKRSN